MTNIYKGYMEEANYYQNASFFDTFLKYIQTILLVLPHARGYRYIL